MSRRIPAAAQSKGSYFLQHENKADEPRVPGELDPKSKTWYEDATDSSSETAKMMLFQWIFAILLIAGVWFFYFDEFRAMLGI
ncbi:hypothetical protein SUNI508_12416 [Seiridium unicorne]|uniref:Uncharacterized protein n=1 Tax=Seiridium unicorne TaxID=138068 RepID=A0ABR2UDX9_9PEZI